MNLKKFYSRLSAKQAAFIAVFFWASAFVFTKYVLKYIDVKSLAVIRYFFAALILLIIAIVKKIKFPAFKDLAALFMAAFFGYSGYFIVFNIAMQKISPSTASVINALSPAITGIIAYFLFKEKINLFGWFSLLISFIGIVILTMWDGVFSINIGIIYMLIACIFISLSNIFQRGLAGKKYTSLELIIYSMIIGALQLLAYSPSSLLNIYKIKIHILFLIIYMAIFPSIVAYLFWVRAFEISKSTTEVTSFMFVTPVIATLMGIIILGDIPKFSTFLGGSIIILGMISFNKTKDKS
ncbi:MAG: DMT family transporter [Fusobacterium sp.]|uniref:DMT family transporter n=1 Tax=Fusobacterium sp. TaxID=68766 RepID=UPI0026DDB8C2|nr:DMT family transporter [Fusobacterium sp.]MDO4690231.1 DMT family transporter [Fusobacterium sp.]